MEHLDRAKIEEDPVRHIEIIITNEKDEFVFEASGNVTRKTSHRFLEGLGYVFIPEEPPKALKLGIPLPAKVSCELIRECSDYYEKCFKCNRNVAKSYFLPKEDDLPAYPVIIGSDLARADDVNYFYYEPGTDASIVVQAAVDYLKAKMEEAGG